MKMDSLVSIIIPVYNSENKLVRCLESAINQTYRNLEIIIVNDGSTDGSNNICKLYKRKDNRVVIIQKENGGLSSARNAGLNVCKGDYISFLDSDDYIDLNFIKNMIDTMNFFDCDLCVAPIFMDNNGVITKFIDFKKEKIKEFICLGFPVWNKLYKRKLFNNIRFPLNKYAEDAFIYCDVVYSALNICSVSETGYYYDKTSSNSITHSLSDKLCMDNLESHLVIMKYLIKNRINHQTINFIMRDSYDIYIFYKFLMKKRGSPESAQKSISILYKKIGRKAFFRLNLKNKFLAFFPVVFYNLREKYKKQ